MTTYYVSINGSDSNSGTISSPWRTIQKAANTMSPGDNTYVREGTYNEIVVITKSGFTIQGYPGETAIIDGGNGSDTGWGAIVHIKGVNNVSFIGFTIQSGNRNGIGIDNSNTVLIQKCTIKNIGDSGLIARGGGGITYDGNIITQTQRNNGNSPDGGQQNENVDMISVNGFEIKNNLIYSTANYESIDSKMGCTSGSIHHNDISPNMSCGIYVDAQGYNIQNIDIYNNIVRANSNSGVRGIALGVENSGSLKNFKVYNNIVYGVGAIGICPGTSYSAGPIDNISVVNNTIYKCGVTDSWGGGIVVEYGSATNIVLRNNICYSNSGRGDIYPNGNTTQDKNFTSNPGFIDTSIINFHLQSNSSAIGTGSTTQFVPSFDYDNNTRKTPTSIGAYEYGVTPPSTTQPPTNQPPGGVGCINCDPYYNYCVANQCIKKEYIFYGIVGFGVLYLMSLLE